MFKVNGKELKRSQALIIGSMGLGYFSLITSYISATSVNYESKYSQGYEVNLP